MGFDARVQNQTSCPFRDVTARLIPNEDKGHQGRKERLQLSARSEPDR